MRHKEPRVLVTPEFIAAVRAFPMAKHVLAVKAGITPAFLSNILNGASTVWPNDGRVRRIAKIVKFAGECFGTGRVS